MDLGNAISELENICVEFGRRLTDHSLGTTQ